MASGIYHLVKIVIFLETLVIGFITRKVKLWRQKSPIIQRRLDFWLVSDTLQEHVETVDIIPSTKSDHSAITLALNGIDESKGGPSFWKFNSTLVNNN